LGYPLRKEKEKLDSINDFSYEQILIMYRDCFKTEFMTKTIRWRAVYYNETFNLDIRETTYRDLFKKFKLSRKKVNVSSKGSKLNEE
jgi:hypothetical protein